MGPARITVVIALVLALAGAAYLFWPWRAEIPPPAPPVVAPPPPVAQGPKHPLPAEAPRELPPLNQSDASIASALAGLLGGTDTLGRLFNVEGFIRNLVATVDNLPRETVAQRVNPLRAIPGLPVTTGKETTLALAPANAARYTTSVRLFESVDTAKLVAAYRGFYPLFQQAYIELGYPNAYFNDRLVEVIDHLLATPEPAGPLKLVQPKVLYEFADPELEERSAGQKAMLRLGRENASRVKAKLREIRSAVTGPA